VPTLRLGHHGEGAELCSRPLDDATLRSTDCALLVTDHSAFDYARIAGLAPLVVDTRNAFRGQVGNIRRA
jgi:UDP-N-acetyl-D-glucosamine dehydrogenase